jgi:Flp pilus assembly protein CpaB
MRIRIIGAIVALLLAVIGAVVLFLYVRGADQRALDGAQLVEVYVVTDEIPAGANATIVAERIEVAELPAMAVLDGRVTNLSQLEGLVSTTVLLPGEQLVQARFADPDFLAAQGDVPVPPGLQEVTVALPVERVVGGAVTPGSEVGIVVSIGKDGGTTQFVFNRVLVTRVQGGTSYVASSDGEDAAPVDALMVTFALSASDVEKVVWAAELQEDGAAGIWLTLQPEEAVPDGSRPVNGDNILP